jgi:hypothetical protein
MEKAAEFNAAVLKLLAVITSDASQSALRLWARFDKRWRVAYLKGLSAMVT